MAEQPDEQIPNTSQDPQLENSADGSPAQAPVDIGQDPSTLAPPQEGSSAPGEPPTAETSQVPKVDVESLKKIIVDTNEILSKNHTNVIEQKKRLTVMLFLLNRLTATMLHFIDHSEKLLYFLYNNEVKQTDWLWQYWLELPKYGDYKDVFTDASEAMTLEGVPHPLSKDKVEELVKNVVDNMYDGGMIVKVQKALGKDIHRRMYLKDDSLMEQLCKMEQWFDLFNVEIKNGEVLETKILDLTNYVGFLTTGVLGSSGQLKLVLRKVPSEEW